MRGHVTNRGSSWGIVVEMGLQPAQRCPACVKLDKHGRAHGKMLWLDGKPLDACPVCGGELEDVHGRRQFFADGFKLKREAQEALDKQLVARREGTYLTPTTLTVGEYLQRRWLSDIKGSLKPGTYASYEQHVNSYLVPNLGTIRLRHLDPGHVGKMFRDLAETKCKYRTGNLSSATRRRIYTTLRKAIGDAERWGLVPRNVAALAERPKADAAPKRLNVWTPSELRVFLGHDADDRLAAMWRTFALTGLRRGEACGLQWRHIDFAHSRLRVEQARVNVGYAVVLSSPKTERGTRTIPLDPGTMAALKAWRDRQADELLVLDYAQSPDTFLFTDAAGEPLHPDRVTKLFEKKQTAIRAAQKKADPKAPMLPRIRLHDVRHTYASMGADAGVHPKVMAERLGHDVMTYMKVYVTTYPGMSETVAELIAAGVDAE